MRPKICTCEACVKRKLSPGSDFDFLRQEFMNEYERGRGQAEGGTVAEGAAKAYGADMDMSANEYILGNSCQLDASQKRFTKSININRTAYACLPDAASHIVFLAHSKFFPWGLYPQIHCSSARPSTEHPLNIIHSPSTRTPRVSTHRGKGTFLLDSLTFS